jgi:hypothetical protein
MRDYARWAQRNFIEEMKSTIFLISCTIFFSIAALGQDDLRKQSVRLSTLPAAQQSAVNSAIQYWNRQLNWKAKNTSAPAADASVATVRLGPANEDDLIVTDKSGCSPTGNCSILVLRPIKDQYRVILEGTGQSFTATPTRANGFRTIKIRVHGSATMSTIKLYKFNGRQYLRAGCHDENFQILDSAGNLQELKKPQITPCH